MRKISWRLVRTEDVVSRYCPNCGRVVDFKNSHKTRSNSNGKNTYHFEIYKCPNGHTWNKKTKTLAPSKNDIEECRTKIDRLTWDFDKNRDSFLIFIESVIGKWRLDKLLSDNIDGLSRKKVSELIDRGYILVGTRKVKSNYQLKNGDEIHILNDKSDCLNLL